MIDLSDRTADAEIGRQIEWHLYGDVWANAIVVSYGQGIYGAASVTLRASDNHESLHVTGLPRDWRYVEPTHQHDCGGCHFLGKFTDGRTYDLWVCPQEPTVIARHGEHGEYLSGLSFTDRIPALGEAHRRALHRGLLPDPSRI